MSKNNPPFGKSKLIVILGPTASGKSDLGIKLAKKFNGEIISADSRQVYKKMDIGTGKVTKREQKIIKHYLLDVADPKNIFTVSDFKKLGEAAIEEIFAKEKIPFIVGGTGFYIDALLKNLNLPEVPANKKLRERFDKLTAEHLFKMLRKLDPKRAKTIDPRNKRRLIRALEIIKMTGRPIPELVSSTKYQVLWLGINPSKKIPEKRIKSRLEKRLKQGMIKEVKNLLESGVSKKRLYDFGLEYRWLEEYLSKKISYAEMKNGLYRAIVNYSKRQMTWFKRNDKIHWIKNPTEAQKLVRKFI